jgi:hypothetical protein
VGSALAGFAARKGTSTGVHDDLFARAVVLDDGTAAVALVSVDVLALSSEFVGRVRSAIQLRIGVPAAAILIASTHTHAGAVTISTFFNPDETLDRGYMSMLAAAIEDAVAGAWSTRFEARAGVGCARIEGLGVNRRSRDGKPIDEEIGILKIDDVQGRTRYVVINHACHPTVLGPDNLLASADFPGVTVANIEAALGGGCGAMFLNGTEGDISVGHSSELSAIGVITPGRTFERASELGRRLAALVLQALPGITTSRSLTLAHDIVAVKLPLKSYPPPAETARALDAAADRVNGFGADQNSPEFRQAKSELLYASIDHYYARELGRYPNGTLPLELQALRIGDHAFVAIPAEVFVEIGIRIKRSAPLPTFIVGVANGYIGYLPSRAGCSAGGYEVVSSRCTPDAEDRLVEGVMQLEERLAPQRAR